MFGHSRKDRIHNNRIRGDIGVAPIKEKLMENWQQPYGESLAEGERSLLESCEGSEER